MDKRVTVQLGWSINSNAPSTNWLWKPKNLRGGGYTAPEDLPAADAVKRSLLIFWDDSKVGKEKFEVYRASLNQIAALLGLYSGL